VIGVRDISQITHQISLNFHLAKFNHIQTKFLHSILQKYYGSRVNGISIFRSFFFFYGRTDSSCIRSLQNKEIKLKNVQKSKIFIESWHFDILLSPSSSKPT